MTKAEDRKLRVVEFYEFVKSQDPFTSRDNLVKAYSFKTGIAVRTIIEYYEVLRSINAINMERLTFESKNEDGTPRFHNNGKVITYSKWKRLFNDEVFN